MGTHRGEFAAGDLTEASRATRELSELPSDGRHSSLLPVRPELENGIKWRAWLDSASTAKPAGRPSTTNIETAPAVVSTTKGQYMNKTNRRNFLRRGPLPPLRARHRGTALPRRSPRSA